MVLHPRHFSSKLNISSFRYLSSENIVINKINYPRDEFTNVTPRILSHLDRRLHLQPCHPLW